jgi:hypothetical protein
MAANTETPTKTPARSNLSAQLSELTLAATPDSPHSPLPAMPNLAAGGAVGGAAGGAAAAAIGGRPVWEAPPSLLDGLDALQLSFEDSISYACRCLAEGTTSVMTLTLPLALTLSVSSLDRLELVAPAVAPATRQTQRMYPSVFLVYRRLVLVPVSVSDRLSVLYSYCLLSDMFIQLNAAGRSVFFAHNWHRSHSLHRS